MTTPPTAPQRFLAVVEPAARRLGFLDYGGKARLSRATGITDSSLSRMFKGQAIPEVAFFEPLANALELDVRDLLVAAGLFSDASLSETRQSQVRSVPPTPEAAAVALGITSPRGMEMFLGMVETLRKGEAADHDHEERGDAATGRQ